MRLCKSSLLADDRRSYTLPPLPFSKRSYADLTFIHLLPLPATNCHHTRKVPIESCIKATRLACSYFFLLGSQFNGRKPRHVSLLRGPRSPRPSTIKYGDIQSPLFLSLPLPRCPQRLLAMMLSSLSLIKNAALTARPTLRLLRPSHHSMPVIRSFSVWSWTMTSDVRPAHMGQGNRAISVVVPGEVYSLLV